MGQVVLRVDGGPHFAAVRAQEAEVAFAHFRGRTVAAQSGDGQPLVSLATIVNLIASTTTTTGLLVQAALDTNAYETGIKISDEQMAKLRLTP